MALTQSIDGCLATAVGELGLPEAKLESWLAKVAPGIDKLRQAYDSRSLPLLRVPERQDDIGPARDAMGRLSQGADTIVFFGTGGSSLGGQTLAQLGGWHIPGAKPKGAKDRPRVRFYDNLDPATLDLLLTGDLEGVRFVVVSKSGNTPETLVQVLTGLKAVQERGLGTRIPKLFLGLTEPAIAGVGNGLRKLCDHFGVPVLDHDPGIGGRYSALTNVGLLPALARGLDVEALRAGAREVVDELRSANKPGQSAPALGATITIALAKERGIHSNVLLPYNDRLARFSAWYVQLWAESLGKGGEGTTPVAALGPVDQHSQLQLWLDGLPHHMVTVLRVETSGKGPRIDPELAGLAGASYLGGRTAGDVVSAQQKAIPEALMQAGRPVRTIDLDRLDEHTLGGLMMHFMLETILAAHLLAVDPFDQPAVEAGKVLTRKYLSANEEKAGGRPRAAAATR